MGGTINWKTFKHYCSFVDSKAITYFIGGVIVLNAIVLALQTNKQLLSEHGTLIAIADYAILGIFILEFLARFIYLDFKAFRKDGWNWFDFFIIAISLMPAANPGLRALRTLRLFKLFRIIPPLHRIVGALVRSLGDMIWIMVLTGFFLFVFVLIGTFLYQDILPDKFGTLKTSAVTLFQFASLTAWSWDTINAVAAEGPIVAFLFFLFFFLLVPLMTLNMIIGVLTNALSEEKERKKEQEDAERDQKIDEILNLLKRNEKKE